MAVRLCLPCRHAGTQPFMFMIDMLICFSFLFFQNTEAGCFSASSAAPAKRGAHWRPIDSPRWLAHMTAVDASARVRFQAAPL